MESYEVSKLIEAMEYYMNLVEKQQDAMEAMHDLIRKQGDLISQLMSVREAERG